MAVSSLGGPDEDNLWRRVESTLASALARTSTTNRPGSVIVVVSASAWIRLAPIADHDDRALATKTHRASRKPPAPRMFGATVNSTQ